MANSSSSTPIIIGVGEIRQKDFALEHCLEPAALMLSAIRDASRDSTIDVTKHIQSVYAVPPWSWNYENLPKLLAEGLGGQATDLAVADHGGNTPAALCDFMAAKVARGETKMGVVTGGEALASCRCPVYGWARCYC